MSDKSELMMGGGGLSRKRHRTKMRIQLPARADRSEKEQALHGNKLGIGKEIRRGRSDSLR